MTKQVSLAEATYARLKRHRRRRESFSQAIDRLLDEQGKDPLAFPNRVPNAPITEKKWLRRIETDRESTRVES